MQLAVQTMVIRHDKPTIPQASSRRKQAGPSDARLAMSFLTAVKDMRSELMRASAAQPARLVQTAEAAQGRIQSREASSRVLP